MTSINKIGIIGAMEEEVEYLVSALEQCETQPIFIDKQVNIGKLHNKEVIIVQSGIGKVNAACATQVLIFEYKCDAIINIGVAGAISSEVCVGDVIIGKKLIHHDFDASAVGYNLGEIPDMNCAYFDCNKSLIDYATSACESMDCSYHTGIIASGDQFIAKNSIKHTIFQNTGALCCEMEGAAIAQTCWINRKLPCLVLRTISDGANDEANNAYEQNEHSQALQCAKIAEKLISRL